MEQCKIKFFYFFAYCYVNVLRGNIHVILIFTHHFVIVDTFTGTIIKWSTDKKSNQEKPFIFSFLEWNWIQLCRYPTFSDVFCMVIGERERKQGARRHMGPLNYGGSFYSSQFEAYFSQLGFLFSWIRGGCLLSLPHHSQPCILLSLRHKPKTSNLFLIIQRKERDKYQFYLHTFFTYFFYTPF